jgi:hypothetical protein
VSWSAAFLDALAEPTTSLDFAVEYVETVDFGIAWSAGSGVSPGVIDTTCYLAPDTVQVQGARMSPRGWSATLGAFSLGLVGDLATFWSSVPRGAVLKLRAAPVGWPLADYQTIAVGVFWKATRQGRAALWSLEVRDILAGCLRPPTKTGVPLFNGLSSTTVAATYTAGDATLGVAGTSLFERETSSLTGGSATGAVKVTNLSGTAFFLTYTGTATGPVRFTGVSSSAQFGTTAATANVGSVVDEVAYLYGHPLDIARRILTSSDGSNGGWDRLPSTWGLRIAYTLLDHTDITAHRDQVMVPLSGSWVLDVPETETQEDGPGWLIGILSTLGVFVCQRQGLLTVRPGQASITAGYVSDFDLTDADLLTDATIEHDDYDTEHAPEYDATRVRSATGSTTSSGGPGVATLPADDLLEYDASAYIFANESACRAEILARVSESAQRVPERVALSCTLRAAQLAPGDVIRLTSAVLSSRTRPAGFLGSAVLVSEVATDWLAGVVRIVLLCYPPTDDR